MKSKWTNRVLVGIMFYYVFEICLLFSKIGDYFGKGSFSSYSNFVEGLHSFLYQLNAPVFQGGMFFALYAFWKRGEAKTCDK